MHQHLMEAMLRVRINSVINSVGVPSNAKGLKKGEKSIFLLWVSLKTIKRQITDL